MRKGKDIILTSGSEEGMSWKLGLDVCENIKNFTGHFVTYGEEARRKGRIRVIDRTFFRLRLSKEMIDKYEIDHDWGNGARVTLKTPQEHRNTPLGKVNQKDWIEEEEWIQEK